MKKNDFDLTPYLHIVENFPKKGISFIDITTLLKDGEIFHQAINNLTDFAKEKKVTKIVGTEARGFIVGCPIAYALKVGFIPVRKPGKLPRETNSQSYDLEYGTNTLEISKGDLSPDDRVLITDDLLATGGTLEATIKLVEQQGAQVVGIACLIELAELEGRKKLNNIDIKTLKIY